MSVYALDSNIISFYFEVKRGLLLINATKQLTKLETLCDLFPVGELGDYLLEEAINIYVRERRRIETPKTLIFLSLPFAYTIIIPLLPITPDIFKAYQICVQ